MSERAWRQVSVSAHECMGGKCPLVAECFVERAREAAKDVDVIVTNHSFMAIDSFEGRQMLPEHDVLVVDEAHELVDRVTATITDELTGTMVMTAAKKAGRMSENTAPLDEAGELLAAALEPLEEGRMLGIPDSVGLALARVRDTARAVQSDLKPPPGQEADGARQVARAAVDEVHENAERILEERELDVVWLNRDQRRGPVLRVAPMSVAMLVRDKVFEERTVVLTSATLELGGTLRRRRRHHRAARRRRPEMAGPRRRQPLRLPEAGHRLRRGAPSAARAATEPATTPSTRSSSSCVPPAGARSASSRRCARRRPPPR